MMTLSDWRRLAADPAGYALHPRCWPAMAEALNSAAGFDPAKTRAQHLSSFVSGDRVASRPYAIERGVAQIPIRGMLLPRFGWIGCDFATGYDAIRLMAEVAFADPEARGVAYIIGSGGGATSGCFPLVRALWRLAAETGKRTAAVCDEHAYSAGYALACAADQIAVSPSGGVGSIGCYRMHVDWSEALKKDGVAITFVAAGSEKVEGNPYQPLDDAVKGRWLAPVEDSRRQFAEIVAKARGLTVDAVLGTEAHAFDGRDDLEAAKTLGLIDAVADPEDALSAFADLVA